MSSDQLFNFLATSNICQQQDPLRVCALRLAQIGRVSLRCAVLLTIWPGPSPNGARGSCQRPLAGKQTSQGSGQLGVGVPHTSERAAAAVATSAMLRFARHQQQRQQQQRLHNLRALPICQTGRAAYKVGESGCSQRCGLMRLRLRH